MYPSEEELKKRKREEMERKVFGRDKSTLVPAFLTKTYEIMHSPEYEQFISWNDDNDAIRINDVVGFSKFVVPKYFKHSNFASFVRQLNMYGFHKTKQDPDWREFQHKYFKKNRYDLLRNIKRKHPIKPSSALIPSDSHFPKDEESIYDQVAVLQDKYDNLERKYDKVLQESIHLSELVKGLTIRGDSVDDRFAQTRAYMEFLLQKALDCGMINKASLLQLTTNPNQDSFISIMEPVMMPQPVYPLIKDGNATPCDQDSSPYSSCYPMMDIGRAMPSPSYLPDPPSPPIIEDLDALPPEDSGSYMF